MSKHFSKWCILFLVLPVTIYTDGIESPWFYILVKMGTYICAHACIFFKLRILITHYIQTMKMYLLNKIHVVNNKA